ncbi:MULTISPECIES: fimbrial protein [Pseudomonas]|uniref:fimbrial protein n=1 Tax=Pseudomonas TaxID=286 RepID=UPI00147377C9|nr:MULTISPECIES: fimbrial protein [Pseudomonas]NNA56103.1 type 1 fimbrial protein [Pseudomonas koreensis]
MKKNKYAVALMTFTTWIILMKMSPAYGFDFCSGPFNPVTVNFNGPSILGVPSDTPIGEEIYSEESVIPSLVVFSCMRASFNLWLTPDSTIGPNPAGANLFVIDGTGVSYKVQILGSNITNIPIPSKGAALKIPPPPFLDVDYFLGRYGERLRMTLIKTGNKAGTVKLPAGVYGKIDFGNSSTNTILKINLKKEIPAQLLSCTTPDVLVSMGEDYGTSEFSADWAQSKPVPFSIKLLNCPPGIKKITYKLISNTPAIDAETGIVSLNKNSTAKQVGLRIMTQGGSGLPLNAVHTYTGYNGTKGDYEIPLSAAYVHLPGGAVSPGTANSELTMAISYL